MNMNRATAQPSGFERALSISQSLTLPVSIYLLSKLPFSILVEKETSSNTLRVFACT